MRMREAWSILALAAWGAIAVVTPAASFAADAERLQMRVGVSPDYPPLAFKEGRRAARRRDRFRPQAGGGLRRRRDVRRGEVRRSHRRAQEAEDRRHHVRHVDHRRPPLRRRLHRSLQARRADGARSQEPTRYGSRLAVRSTRPECASASWPRPPARCSPAGVSTRRPSRPSTLPSRASRPCAADSWTSSSTTPRRSGAPSAARVSEDPDLTGIYRPLTEEHLAWAVRKEDAELKGFLNAALAHWRKTGEIDSIVDRWVPVRKFAVDLP